MSDSIFNALVDAQRRWEAAKRAVYGADPIENIDIDINWMTTVLYDLRAAAVVHPDLAPAYSYMSSLIKSVFDTVIVNAPGISISIPDSLGFDGPGYAVLAEDDWKLGIGAVAENSDTGGAVAGYRGFGSYRGSGPFSDLIIDFLKKLSGPFTSTVRRVPVMAQGPAEEATFTAVPSGSSPPPPAGMGARGKVILVAAAAGAAGVLGLLWRGQDIEKTKIRTGTVEQILNSVKAGQITAGDGMRLITEMNDAIDKGSLEHLLADVMNLVKWVAVVGLAFYIVPPVVGFITDGGSKRKRT